MSVSGKRPSSRDVASNRAPERLSIDEASARYAGRWVLMLISEFDVANSPAAGVVIAHGADKEMHRALKTLPAPDDPERPYYLFSAYPRIRSGAAWREVLAQVAAEGDVRVPRQP